MATELTSDFIKEALTDRGGFSLETAISDLRTILSLDPADPKRVKLISNLFADQDETRTGIEAGIEAGETKEEEVPTDVTERLAKASKLKEMLLKGEGTKELGLWIKSARIDTGAILDRAEAGDEMRDGLAVRARDAEREAKRMSNEPIVLIPED